MPFAVLRLVASYSDAWIEIVNCNLHGSEFLVAFYADARIEMWTSLSSQAHIERRILHRRIKTIMKPKKHLPPYQKMTWGWDACLFYRTYVP